MGLRGKVDGYRMLVYKDGSAVRLVRENFVVTPGGLARW